MHLKIDEPSFLRNLLAFAIGLIVLLIVLIIVKWFKAFEDTKNEQLQAIKITAKKFDEFFRL